MTLVSRFQMAPTALSQLTKMLLHSPVLLRYEGLFLAKRDPGSVRDHKLSTD